MMRRAAALLVAAIAAGALAACEPAPRPLDDVEVRVYQPRTDIATGRLAIQVANGSDDDLEVVGARVSSPGFAAEVAWDGDGTVIGAGRTIDLRAPLPAFDCDTEGAAEVALDYRDGEATRTVRFAPDDPFGLLPRLRAEQCLGAEIARIVAIVPREVRVPDPAGAALLVFEVTPTGAPGTVVIDAVDGTTLIQPAVDGVAVRDVLPLGVELSAEGPRELAIPFVPNRCDAHALADDKVGTIIPFTVTTGDAHEVRWMLPTPDRLRGELYAYYAGHCGLAAS